MMRGFFDVADGRVVCVVSFIGLAWKTYSIPTDWTVGVELLRHTLGFVSPKYLHAGIPSPSTHQTWDSADPCWSSHLGSKRILRGPRSLWWVAMYWLGLDVLCNC